MRFAILIAALLLASAAGAEQADRDKPIQVEADKLDADEVKQVAIYSGNVRITQGTLRIDGQRLELREDPEGYRSGVVTAAPGQLVLFRQRRDPKTPGVEEWVEGQAERLEYDQRTDRVKLLQRAKLRRTENGEQRDELTGQVIVYEQRSARTTVEGGPTASPDGRVRTTIAPRKDAKDPKDAKPAALAPAPQMAAPRKD